MHKQFLRVIFVLLVCFTLPLTATAQVVDIPDPKLRAKIEAALGKAPGATITIVEMATLTKLDARYRRISNLTGLEHATNLTELNLSGNFISNISPLSGVTNLTQLWLYKNYISDLSPLAGLINLTELGLGENSISDISALADLTKLTKLHLYENSIPNISPLSGLTNLTQLWLFDNFISNISPLSGLTNLTELRFRDNFISDISPLSGLTNLTELNLDSNAISNISPLSDLTNLTSLYLARNSISDISPLVGLIELIDLNLEENAVSDISPLSGLTELRWLFLAENTISDLLPLASLTKMRGLFLGRNAVSNISPLSGLTDLVSLELWGNSISDLSPLVSNTGLDSENEVDVRGNPLNAISINTHIPTLQGRGVRVNFYIVGTETVNIPDRNLRAKIEKALGKVPGATITTAGMATLTWLYADDANVSNLTGLEHAINLRSLYLDGNTISDIAPLAGLTKLEWLFLHYNNISDISALTDLTKLEWLSLNNNNISDISPLAGLTSLIQLSLWGNSISDLSPLSSNTGLGDGDGVDVRGNPLNATSINTHIPILQEKWVGVWFDAVETQGVTIADRNLRTKIEKALVKTYGATITTAEMAKLTVLNAGGANISNLSGLEHATNLTWLSLWGNSISDISPVAGLTDLTALYLWDNNISDLSPLVANTGLGSGDTVSVRGNPLSYLSIGTHIPALQSRGVIVEFDNQAQSALLKISGDNQKGASFAPLPQPFVVEAQDENGSALAGISVTFSVTEGDGTLSTTTARTDLNGRAQSTLTLSSNLGGNTVEVSAAGIQGKVTFHAIADTELSPITADVNRDGNVNIFDLILVASAFGSVGFNLAADVNGDEVVNILDLVLVAGMFDGATAAPSVQPQVPETLTAIEVRGWLTDARSLQVKDPIMKRGIMVLEQLLVFLTPRETELLANYPNPFNPETWIPYRLAEEAFVTLTIYDTAGQTVRTLDIGHRIASAYENRSKAIYWNGRNDAGEQVASGVYFYTLTAGDFSATRKMLILK